MRCLAKSFVLSVFVWSIFSGSFAFCADLNEELITAAEKGDIGTLQALLAKGADINAKDNDGNTALMVASDMSQGEGGTLLVQEAYLNTSTSGGKTVFSETVLSKTALPAPDMSYIEIVKILLAQGADVNVKANNGVTALMRASWKGHGEIVKILLAKGADVNVKSNSGATALMMASRKGHCEVVKTLIAQGVDVNAKDNDGYTALKMLSWKGDSEIAQLLKESGAKE